MTWHSRYFFEAAKLQETNDCILWPYGTDRNGYAMMRHKGRKVYAARRMCEEMHGPPPTPEHESAHSCHKRRCINKRHVRWKTHAENMAESAGRPEYLASYRCPGWILPK